MGYIAVIIAVVLLFFFFRYFIKLEHRQKIAINTGLLVLVLFAYLYNQYKAKEQEKMLDIVVKYKQGKTIKCGKYDVNSTYFSLSTGTYTFIGKQNTPYYAVMISAYECE